MREGRITNGKSNGTSKFPCKALEAESYQEVKHDSSILMTILQTYSESIWMVVEYLLDSGKLDSRAVSLDVTNLGGIPLPLQPSNSRIPYCVRFCLLQVLHKPSAPRTNATKRKFRPKILSPKKESTKSFSFCTASKQPRSASTSFCPASPTTQAPKKNRAFRWVGWAPLKNGRIRNRDAGSFGDH